MNNKGQLAGWEAVIILLLLAYAGFSTYLWATKQSQTVNNNKGSHPTINGPRVDWPFSIHIGEGGCSMLPIKGNKDANINKAHN